ncbi:CoF synthetase [Maritimibacter sp. UBA3975]|mgnify:CR=1 FL=1|uniref:CoF synthetase n=1 Tax=Maritimibacter sp. UBA3975 TaxID=1946833 RepID=UPI000C0B3550|nr:CoF synthetase [Maritimibacter sp. UBA3975]MAM62001.1 CoF synthetase [Maritimibacter sp.]
MIPAGEAIGSFLTARRMGRAGLSRARFESWQARRLSRWLARDLPRVRAYVSAPDRLDDLPITDKATLMADFSAYNIHGITSDQVRAAIASDCRIGSLTVGQSTGTSGNRGYFVISDGERFRWLGAILAKAIPDLVWRRPRVAIVLPQSTPLYDSARQSGRIDLRFFDLVSGPDQWIDDLAAFDPTVVVAPPKILRHLAERGVALAPTRTFAAAETLDPVDRPVIEAAFGPLEQIYMATEGLLGVTCRHGRLHLCEDSMKFEFEPVGDGLVTPLVTCLGRQVQIMARYRMNDLLRLSATPCPCGSPLQAVDEVVGRMDDIFRIGGTLITPDVLRNAVLDAGPGIDDFRIIQTGPETVDLTLPPAVTKAEAQAAVAALTALLRSRAKGVKVTLTRAPLTLETAAKLRRVACHLPHTDAS